MKKNGFTLIELIVVIVVLGVLTVAIAPRYLNLQQDARNASLEALKGAIEDGISLGYSKLAINGLESLPYVSNHESYEQTPAQSLPISGCELYAQSGNHCTFLYGYPDAEEYTLPRLVQNLESDSDWVMLRTGEGDQDYTVKITSKDNVEGSGPTASLINANCYLLYTAANHTTKRYQLDMVKCI